MDLLALALNKIGWMTILRMYNPNRADVLTVVFVLLTISALGAVGATIQSVQGGESGGPDISVGDRSVDGPEANTSANNSGDFSGAPGGGSGQTIDLVICIDFLTTTPAMLTIFGSVVILVFGVYRKFNLATGVIFGSCLVPIVWISYFFTTNCAGSSGGGGGFSPGSSVVSNQGGLESPPLPPAVIAGLFGIVVLVGIAALFTMSGEEETFEPVEEEPDAPDTAAFAEAAGRAADRIAEADVPVDNAVYRAWFEMVTLLNIEDPETTAPIDFADAAVDAGLDRDDVDELTELFTEVRYGGKDAAVREDRALEILRTIERTYDETASTAGGDE